MGAPLATANLITMATKAAADTTTPLMKKPFLTRGVIDPLLARETGALLAKEDGSSTGRRRDWLAVGLLAALDEPNCGMSTYETLFLVTIPHQSDTD